jgi:hypothetical protein
LADVVSWWAFLCAMATLNVAAWSLTANALMHKERSLPVQTYAAGRIQLALSAVYVFGCAFRSVLPVYDIPRLCLFDTWLSDVIVGRSIATIAELSFVAQWALMLHSTAEAVGSSFARRTSVLLLPLIVLAEICSWYAVLTRHNLGHVAENSLWAISVLLATASVVPMVRQCTGQRRRIMIAWCVAGLAYVTFMFMVDVPTYWARYISDEAHGRHYLTVLQGIADAASHRVVSYRWRDWQSEVVWMSLYFSVAVWLSISLTHVRASTASLERRGSHRPAVTAPGNSRSASTAR